MGKQVVQQKNGIDGLLLFVFAIGIMVSSDTLVVLGNFFGKTGNVGFFLIIFSAIIYLALLSQYKQLFIFSPVHSSDIEILKTVIGTLLAFFPFIVKIIAIVFLSIGLLVSSGFVFNEVFLYWFPNFGFAFILLGLLFSLQFLPDKVVSYLQIGFAGIPIFGLLILIIAGIIQTDQLIHFKPGNIEYSINSTGLNTSLLPLLFFVGVDLGLSICSKSDKKQSGKYNIIFAAVIFMCILFGLWGYVSLKFVPSEKLIHTSIPHMIAAKNILGDPGRFIMGTIVISGSLAAIHALFTIIARQSSQLLNTNMFPKNIWRPKIIIIFPALIIAGMMASGMAGEEELETFIRASLILWLMSYALISLSHIIILRRSTKRHQTVLLFQKTIGTMCLLILGISILILTLMDDKPILILKFLGAALFISFITGILFMLKNKISGKLKH
jgi:L-asparagine transporter-like permease